MKEEQIIELIQAGKVEKAFVKLYKLFPKTRAILKKYGAGRDQSYDIFQDALVALYQKLDRSDFKIETSIESYLINTCKFMYFRVSKTAMSSTELTEQMMEESDIETILQEEQKMIRAESVLQQMGEKCRQILMSFYIHKKSMKEIADQFSFSSENAAKTQKYKCLEAARNNYRQLNNIHDN